MNSKLCQKVVHNFLFDWHEDIISISAKLIPGEKSDEIALLQIGRRNGHVHIFDLKICPRLMHEGELWRLLTSPDIIKVIHDCRRLSASLMKHFKVTMQGIFDTQVAYCVLMIERQLPPRLISLSNLCEKYGDPGRDIAGSVQPCACLKSHGDHSMYWARRPLGSRDLECAAQEVRVLLPVLHQNMTRELPSTEDSVLQDLCYAFVHGKFTSCRGGRGTGYTSKPVLQLSDIQRYLLRNTIPQSVGGL